MRASNLWVLVCFFLVPWCQSEKLNASVYTNGGSIFTAAVNDGSLSTVYSGWRGDSLTEGEGNSGHVCFMSPGSVCVPASGGNCFILSEEECNSFNGCEWIGGSCADFSCSQWDLNRVSCEQSANSSCTFIRGNAHNARSRMTDPSNLLFGACSGGFCSSSIPCSPENEDGFSHGNAPTKFATDGNTNTASMFWYNADRGLSYFIVMLPRPRKGASFLFLKSMIEDAYSLNAILEGGSRIAIVKNFTQPISGAQGQTWELPSEVKSSVLHGFELFPIDNEGKSRQYKPARISEIAAYADSCSIDLTFVFDGNQMWNLTFARVFGFVGSGIERITVERSLDGEVWHGIPNATLESIDTAFTYNDWMRTGVQVMLSGTARYLRFSAVTNPYSHMKTKVGYESSRDLLFLGRKALKLQLYNCGCAQVKEIEVHGNILMAPACPNKCSGHGTCGENGVCMCNEGFAGQEDCALKDCAGGCGLGICSTDGVCRCPHGWHGSSCELRTGCPNDCWGHGICINGSSCACTSEFYGEDCGCRKQRPIGFGHELLSGYAEEILAPKHVPKQVVPRAAWANYPELYADDVDSFSLITDGATGPQWQSHGGCRSSLLSGSSRRVRDSTQNALYRACELGLCTASCECSMTRVAAPSTCTAYTCSSQLRSRDTKLGVSCPYPIDVVTDGNGNNGAFVRFNHATQSAWFQAMLPSPSRLSSVYIRAHTSQPAEVIALVAGNNEPILLDDSLVTDQDAGTGFIPGRHYFLNSDDRQKVIIGVRVTIRTQSGNTGACYGGEGVCRDFTMKELVAFKFGAHCHDDIVVDLGAVHKVAIMRVEIYSNHLLGMRVLTSVDNHYYQPVATINYTSSSAVDVGDRFYWVYDTNRTSEDNVNSAISLPGTFRPEDWAVRTPLHFLQPREARYLKVEAYNDMKISVMEISTWGAVALNNESRACINECSGHGSCIDYTSGCVCTAGFAGIDCSIPPCSPSCSAHGRCVSGVCICDVGSFGPSCEYEAPCANDCWGRGICSRGQCEQGGSAYDGIDLRYEMLNTSSIGGSGVIKMLDLSSFPSIPSRGSAAVDDSMNTTQANRPLADVQLNSDKSGWQWTGMENFSQTTIAQGLQFVIPPISNAASTATSKLSTVKYGVDGDAKSYWKSNACQNITCVESFTVDLKKTILIGAVRFDGPMQDAAVNTFLDGSVDRISWTMLAEEIPNAWYGLELAITPAQKYRYVRVSWILRQGQIAIVREILLWGEHGPFGPAKTFELTKELTKRSLKEMLGVNSIWGFGTDAYSDTAYRPLNGPHGFATVASKARCYHNWHWDAKDPDDIVDFATMGCAKGTASQWWLDWHREYKAWTNAGMSVHACIQFHEAGFASSMWDNAYKAAFNYGVSFATAFGPSHGTGAVTVLEIGNEPDYSIELYSEILLGMARGAKLADPQMLVIPGIPYIEHKGVPFWEYLTSDHLEVLDAINSHAYSWASTAKGRTGVHPESKVSSFRSLIQQIAVRDASSPALPFFLTEFGWDSAGAGEACEMSECVSERAQALYAVRAALWLQRMGVHSCDWFFYGNTPKQDGSRVFSRSGLRGSREVGHVAKQSFYAMELLVKTIGDLHVVSVIREDDEAWAYGLGPGENTTHIVIWRPVNGDDTSTRVVIINGTADAAVSQVWTLSGDSSDSEYIATESVVQQHEKDQLSVRISAVPLVLMLSDSKSTCMCSKHGRCVGDSKCICFEGFHGPKCKMRECPHHCWNRGVCNVDTGKCKCSAWINDHAGVNSEKVANASAEEIMAHPEWIMWDDDSNCEFAKCALNCLGRGRCSQGRCDCDAGWTGKNCELKACPFSTGRGEAFDCRSHGTCINGVCTCDGSDQLFTSGSDSCAWRHINKISDSCSSLMKPHRCKTSKSGAMSRCVSAIGTCPDSYILGNTSNTTAPWTFVEIPTPIELAIAEVSSNPQTAHRAIDQYGVVTPPYSHSAWQSSSSEKPAFLFEGQAAEFLTVDLGADHKVGAVSLQRYQYALDTNVDSAVQVLWQWQHHSNMDKWITFHVDEPPSQYTVDLDVTAAIEFTTRLIRFVFVRSNVSEWNAVSEVNVWGVVVWGESGPFPAAPPFSEFTAMNTITLKETLGINAIWGFGTNKYSDNSVKWGKSERASVYGTASIDGVGFTHARNYHNMFARQFQSDQRYKFCRFFSALLPHWKLEFVVHCPHANAGHWDVLDPDRPPIYSEMTSSGHDGKLRHEWLNWDREYTTWNKAGMEVHASIQFTSADFPAKVWRDPYRAAFNFGYGFAEHFGPTFGTGDVSVMEIGNEPDYSIELYSEILLGMARGAKLADPQMLVIPGIPYIEHKGVPFWEYLTSDHLEVLDAINSHAYSWASTAKGRTGVHPESKVSSFRSLIQQIAVRDASSPACRSFSPSLDGTLRGLVKRVRCPSASVNEPRHYMRCVPPCGCREWASTRVIGFFFQI